MELLLEKIQYEKYN